MGLKMQNSIGVGGVVTAVQYRGGVEIARTQRANTVTDAGLNILLDTLFSGVPAGSWFLGLRGNGAQSPADTLAVKDWTEFTGYVGGRQPWVHAPAADGVLTSGAAATFVIQGGESIIRGAFLTDGEAKTGGGRLFMVANFGAALILYPADVVEVRYELTVARRA